jgi:tellurite resistance protein TehA-like permease
MIQRVFSTILCAGSTIKTPPSAAPDLGSLRQRNDLPVGARYPRSGMSKGNFAANVARGIRDLRPDSYALVMATGIIAIAASRAGMAPVSWVLFQIARLAYAVLWCLTLARLLLYRPRLIQDLTVHARGAGFLTVVAATCVVGSLYVLLSADRYTASVLWVLGTVLWVILLYAFFAAVTARDPKPNLEDGLDGTWLLPVVATQSLSLLATLVAPAWGSRQSPVLMLALTLYLLGCMFYIPVIVLIGYRLLFRPVTPAALTPSYWITMGALAISTLAGTSLVAAAAHSAVLQDALPGLKILTLALWTGGTWWIPLLIILTVWRHTGGRTPLTYSPEYWSMVFPLGMYAACTFEIATLTGEPALRAVASDFLDVALAAWVWAFTGLLRGLTPVRRALPERERG